MLTGALFLLFGVTAWLLVRPPVLHAAVAAVLPALLSGTLELLLAAAGPFVLAAAFALAAVSAMINSFREMANQKGIESQVAISNDLQQIPCTTYETNTIIGNLIQNAMDELDQNTELRPWISVLILKRGGNHIIKITNPCHQSEEEFRNCFRPGFTTKQSHEDIGLTTVMRIVTRYHGAVLTEFDSGVISFIVQIPGFFE